MNRTIIGTMFILVMLNAAHADTWVFRDTLRPNGHDRSQAAKRADGRKCGSSRGWFSDGPRMQQCMLLRGWVLDHVIPDPPSAPAHVYSSGNSPPPIDNSSSNDDWVQHQQDQDNIQQMVNQQNQNDIQRMNQDEFDQQQQMINNDR